MPAKHRSTKPLGEVVLGIGGAFGRTYVDVEYEYRYMFHSSEPVSSRRLPSAWE